MADFSYSIALTAVIAANSRAILQHQIPIGQSLVVNDLLFTATGAFDIIGIRDTEGNLYTNASESAPIKSTHVKSGANNNNALNPFHLPASIKGGVSLQIELKDTTGAPNTVNMTLLSIRKTGA